MRNVNEASKAEGFEDGGVAKLTMRCGDGQRRDVATGDKEQMSVTDMNEDLPAEGGDVA